MTTQSSHTPTCQCGSCQEKDNARQRRITLALSTILAGLLYALWCEVRK